jgi:hypothetical protein
VAAFDNGSEDERLTNAVAEMLRVITDEFSPAQGT